MRQRSAAFRYVGSAQQNPLKAADIDKLLAEMLAFEVYINDERLCTAGIGEEGVLTSILTWVKRTGEPERCELEVGGLVSALKEQVRWAALSLANGDEVRVKLIEREQVDSPASRQRSDPQKDLERQKTYVIEMAKRFGWTLQT